jgi:hypothetical protein
MLYAITGHAQSYVAAVQALQQQLAAFAAPTPGTQRAALEAQVSALEQELSRAVCAPTRAFAWQTACFELPLMAMELYKP